MNETDFSSRIESAFASADMDRLAAVVAEFSRAMEEFAQQICEALADVMEPFFESLVLLYVKLQREQLYLRLTSLPIPDRMARWAADHCLERWLPPLDFS